MPNPAGSPEGNATERSQSLCFVRECLWLVIWVATTLSGLDSLRQVGNSWGRTYIGGRFLRGLGAGGASSPETHSNKPVSLFMNYNHKNCSFHFQEIQFASAAHYSISVYELKREEQKQCKECKDELARCELHVQLNSGPRP